MKLQPHDHLGLAQASCPGFCLSHLCSPSNHTPRPSDSVMSSPNLDSDPSPPPCRSSSTLLASLTTARTSAGRLDGLPSNACQVATSLTPLSGSPAEDYRSEGGVRSEEGGSRPSGAVCVLKSNGSRPSGAALPVLVTQPNTTIEPKGN